MSGLRLGWVAAADLLKQVLTVLMIVGLVAAGASLLPFLAIPIPAGLVILGLTIVLVRSDIPVTPSFDAAEWRRLAHDILPFALATAVNVLYFRLAVILVSLLASDDEAGYFGASFRIIEVLIAVPGLIVGAAFPIFARAARDDESRFAYAVDRTFRGGLVLGMWFALALTLGAPVAIDVIAGDEFAPAVDILRVQALAFVVSFPAVTWGHALLSLHRHRTLLWVNLVALVVMAVVTGTLTALEGADGAAVGTAVGELVLAIAVGTALFRLRPACAPPLAQAVRAPAAAVLAAAIAIASGLPALGQVIVATVVFALAALALRAVPEELLVELRRARGRRA